MKQSITLFFLSLHFLSFSQKETPQNNQEKIKNFIQTYFQYDRENIHVQFNKDIYANNEDIAFKGYVLSKNHNTPNSQTTNVQLVIYNDQEQIVQKQLLYTFQGTFAGGIHLSDKYKAGKYHFHFYTNWMNNFDEDDSFTQFIEIINKDEPYSIKSNDPNWKTAKVTLFPEGGDIIDAMTNTVGIKITDCNQKGIEISQGLILDSKSNEITHFSTNKMGNGAFYFIPDIKETYTLKIKSDKLNISQPLPITKETGIVLSYNNNLPKNLFAVAIKTNEKGLEIYKNKKYIILIHQDAKSVQNEFTFNNKETEQVIMFNKSHLANGVNSIRLIDEKLNEITERLVYNYASDKVATTLEAKAIANDSIALSGKIDLKDANISISIVPENNICIDKKKSILGSFYLNAYLENPETDTYAYYDVDNSNKKKDMEALMLNQTRSKFFWENIKNKPPKITYPFIKGVTISGKISKVLNPNSKYQISLMSLKDRVFEETTIDKNNEFKFENFFAQDSTVFLLQMLNEKSIVKDAKMEVRVIPDETKFIHPFRFEKNNCPVEKKAENTFIFSKPELGKDIIDLAGVTIKNTFKKEIFTHQNAMNSNANAYKIGDTDFGTLLDFIGRNGYRTGINQQDNGVYIQSSRGFGSFDQPPSVYIDDQLVLDLNLLYGMYLDEVDEIYIDKSGFSDIRSNGNGTIQIYLKQGGSKSNYFKTKLTSLIVTTAFAKNIDFKNTAFSTQKEFFYFGTLNWSSDIKIRDNSNFLIKFPKGNQKEIQVLIEGFSVDGQLISEIQKVPIQSTQ